MVLVTKTSINCCDHAAITMRFREIGIDLDCPQGRGLRLRKSFRGRLKIENRKIGISIGESSVSRGIRRIQSDGVIEILNCPAEALAGTSAPMVTTLDIGFICFRIYEVHLRELNLLLRR